MLNINHILIIEDNEADAMVCRRYLSKISNYDIKLTWKEMASDALVFLSDNKVDCVLLDYNLPDMSGADFLKKLAKQPFDHPPVLMLTGAGNEKIAVETLKLGAEDYLSKEDLNPELLRMAIFRAVEKSIAIKNAQKNAEDVKNLLQRDYLTGVSNRFHFDETLESTLSMSKRHNKMFAVMLLDLDRFKIVNDQLGHQAGDFLLQEVSKRFLSVLRKEDLLARVGGDEFCVLLVEIKDIEDARVIAEKLILSLKDPIMFGAEKMIVSPSIGIAIYPLMGRSASELLKNADKAMYCKKRANGNGFEFYNSTIR